MPPRVHDQVSERRWQADRGSRITTQDKAIERLTEVYRAKKAALRSQTKAARIEKYGQMRFEEYAADWKSAQRDLSESSLRQG